jgi:hypothetical protein
MGFVTRGGENSSNSSFNLLGNGIRIAFSRWVLWAIIQLVQFCN